MPTTTNPLRPIRLDSETLEALDCVSQCHNVRKRAEIIRLLIWREWHRVQDAPRQEAREANEC